MTQSLAIFLWIIGWIAIPMVQPGVPKVVKFIGLGLLSFTFTVIISYRF